MSDRETPTILIVDDDEGVTTTFARMLRLEGYEVHTALNAETGLQEAEATSPDAIILDLRMPLLDGLGFLPLEVDCPTPRRTGGDRDGRLLPRRQRFG